MEHSDRILVFAPHPDDELLGCGGFLSSKIDRNIHIVYLTVGMNKEDVKLRESEIERVCRNLKATHECYFPEYVGRLDTVPMIDIITKMDKTINKFKPISVFIPYPSYHQDHRVTYQAAVASLRPRRTFQVPMVIQYEYPSIMGQVCRPQVEGGKWYRNISSTLLNTKIYLCGLYQSQVKNGSLILNSVEELATVRGTECGRQYAELFYIQRIIG